MYNIPSMIKAFQIKSLSFLESKKKIKSFEKPVRIIYIIKSQSKLFHSAVHLKFLFIENYFELT